MVYTLANTPKTLETASSSSSKKYKSKFFEIFLKTHTKQNPQKTPKLSTESSPWRWEIMASAVDPTLGQQQDANCQISVGLDLPRR